MNIIISPLLGEHPRIVNIFLGPATVHYREVSLYIGIMYKSVQLHAWNHKFPPRKHLGHYMDFLIHWPPGPVVATVQCQGLDSWQCQRAREVDIQRDDTRTGRADRGSKTVLSQCSAHVFKRAGCHLKRAHLARWTDCQKGTLARWTDCQKGTLAQWTDRLKSHLH